MKYLELDKLPRYEIHKTMSGVYILFNKGKIIYIGQSKRIQSRIATHLETYAFDSYSYIEINNYYERLLTEATLIHWYKPKYNKERKNRVVPQPLYSM
jgi:excinuclease UvrABC nuclease subunit